MSGVLCRNTENDIINNESQRITDDKVRALQSSCGTFNRQLLSLLKPDTFGDELLASIVKDASLGRMTPPTPVGKLGADQILMARRFSVQQSDKIRAVDDESGNGCPTI